MENIFGVLMEDLLGNALKEYQTTPQNQRSREKLDQMKTDCYSMFKDDERDFAEECFTLILDAEEAKTQYVYRKGLLDSVQLLKWLGVLA